jgi:S-disulfanyl-L-cysteine oxidoreductase SoxD
MATVHSRFAIAPAVLAVVVYVITCGATAVTGGATALAERAQSPSLGIGHAPKPDMLKQIDIDVTPDGKGLPPGSGTAAKGKDVYTRRCETCHGPTGKEGPQEALAGGNGSLATAKPQKSVGSYWPYATTLWDYINRAMPFDHPSTLSVDEVYSAAAYVLFLNGIVGEQDVLDQTTLPKIQMPNRNGFVADPRPDVPLKKKP